METYLEFASVVVSQQALEHSRGLARGFMEELGPRLQEMLLDRQKEMDNWVSSYIIMELSSFLYPAPRQRLTVQCWAPASPNR